MGRLDASDETRYRDNVWLMHAYSRLQPCVFIRGDNDYFQGLESNVMDILKSALSRAASSDPNGASYLFVRAFNGFIEWAVGPCLTLKIIRASPNRLFLPAHQRVAHGRVKQERQGLIKRDKSKPPKQGKWIRRFRQDRGVFLWKTGVSVWHYDLWISTAENRFGKKRMRIVRRYQPELIHDVRVLLNWFSVVSRFYNIYLFFHRDIIAPSLIASSAFVCMSYLCQYFLDHVERSTWEPQTSVFGLELYKLYWKT